MSLHKSFAAKGRTGGHRNVLTRSERLAKLSEEERWKGDASVFGLPKVRSIKPKKKGKAAKKADATETPAASGAAPAAGTAPAPAAGADKTKATKGVQKEKK